MVGLITVIHKVESVGDIKFCWEIASDDADYSTWASYTLSTLPDQIVCWQCGKQVSVDKANIKMYNFIDDYSFKNIS